MWLVDQLAEARIEEAMARGEFDELPGRGEPLVLEDDALIPEHLRAGYRLLKNAGYLPPELALHREIKDVEALIRQTTDPGERGRSQRRLSVLRSRLEARRGGRVDLGTAQQYAGRLVSRFDDLDPADGAGR